MLDKNVNLEELNKGQLIELVELLVARVSTLDKRVAQLTKGTQKSVSAPESGSESQSSEKRQEKTRG